LSSPRFRRRLAALAGADITHVYIARLGPGDVTESDAAKRLARLYRPRRTIDTLIDAFDPDLGRHVVVPTYEGKAGNPVLWSRRFFPELMALEGDKGAREMIRANPDAVVWVKAGPSVTHDVDTPEAMAAIGGSWA
jgi:molybdenum cofactor cytidylyltransferase